MIVDGDYRPILVLPCTMSKKKVKFLGPDKMHVVDGKWAKFTKKVIKFCNGSFSIADIAENLRIEKTDIIEQIIVLDRLGVVVDSREQYKHFNRVDSYPTYFETSHSQEELATHHELAMKKFANDEKRSGDTDLFKVLAGRESYRSFSSDGISRAKILTLCRAGYGMLSTGHVTVPSAGGLYPLSLHVIVPKDMKEISMGYYEYDPGRDTLLVHEDEPDIEQVKFCFNNEEMVDDTIQFVISADVDSVAYKYGNRAYRFCLLEAGHVAQNITIAAAEIYLGTCEMGGLLDQSIKNELSMLPNEISLLGMVVGYPRPETKKLNYAKFIEDNIGENKPVTDLCVWSEPESGLFEASVRYTDGENWYFANGTARSNIMAAFKAVVEGYERIAVRKTPGVKNSCGVAAHFSRKKAEEKATLELIERDAIMRCWEEKKAPNRFTPTSVHALIRKDAWGTEGREVTFMRPVSPKAPKIPVVLVTITSDKYPYFVCGAAAGADISEVENKALMEAESILLYYLANPEQEKAPKLKDIKDPEEHGKLYRLSRKAVNKISWLTKGEYTDLDEDKEYLANPDVISEIAVELDICFTTIGLFDNDNLVVIRAESPEMVDMTFGTNGEKILPHFFS